MNHNSFIDGIVSAEISQKEGVHAVLIFGNNLDEYTLSQRVASDFESNIRDYSIEKEIARYSVANNGAPTTEKRFPLEELYESMRRHRVLNSGQNLGFSEFGNRLSNCFYTIFQDGEGSVIIEPLRKDATVTTFLIKYVRSLNNYLETAKTKPA